MKMKIFNSILISILFLSCFCLAQEEGLEQARVIKIYHNQPYEVEYVYDNDNYYPPSPFWNIHYPAYVKVFKIKRNKRKLIWEGSGTYVKENKVNVFENGKFIEEEPTRFESDPENYIKKALGEF